MTRLAVVSLVAVLVGFAQSARAQSEGDAAEAKRHFEQGLRLYNVQSYDEAIGEFKTGYQIDPRPEFLYALGQAQRMNHQCKAAIVSYEAFLRSGPAAKQEAAAHDQIAACRAELATTAPLPGAPAAGPPPSAPPSDGATAIAPPPAKPTLQAAPPASSNVVANLTETSTPVERATPIYHRWWFWTLIGGGVAAGIVIAAAAGAFTRTIEPGCAAPRDCRNP
ncbi:MAG TPA: hypothetical protein VKQ32_25815 [Polyangia bacterium]|nr:hypothetical protein [Polyangia bacterium]